MYLGGDHSLWVWRIYNDRTYLSATTNNVPDNPSYEYEKVWYDFNVFENHDLHHSYFGDQEDVLIVY